MAEQLFENQGSYTPDNLIIGTKDIRLKGVTIISGQKYSRGSVIGITEDGKGKLCNKDSTDGSQVAKYILADDIDTTKEELVAQCYQSGEFNREALIFDEGDSVTNHEDELRKYGIFLKDSIEY